MLIAILMLYFCQNSDLKASFDPSQLQATNVTSGQP